MEINRSLQSGHTVHDLSEEEKEEQINAFTGIADYYKEDLGMVRLNPGNWILPTLFTKYADVIYNFRYRPDDVLIVTIPKCGTTWTQEILWTMIHNKNFDHPMAHLETNARAPFLEMEMLTSNLQKPGNPMSDAFAQMCPGKNADDGMIIQMADNFQSPRIFKTHLPLSLLNKKMLDTCKVIYVLRNPKDVAMSYLHHCRLITIHGFVGTTEEFVDYFMDDKLMYLPFWPHVEEAWERKDDKNMLFIFYEDLKKNTEETYQKINNFVNAKLTPDELSKVIEYTSFASMKKRSEENKGAAADTGELINKEILKADGGFFRKGQVGTWRDALSPEQGKKIDHWTNENANRIGIELRN